MKIYDLRFKKYGLRQIGIRLLLIFLLIPLWVFLRNIYRDRIPAFGCFDDCFNYMGGYFLLHGRHLYSEIFFNHQPIPAYISALIQYLTKPSGIYQLISEHRMFMTYFSLIADIVLTLRFGLSGFAFSVLFETTKGFLFGEHFLAEGMIVYPLVYLLALVYASREVKSSHFARTISIFDLIFSAALSWFVIFSREPYIPLALFFYGYLLWKFRKNIWSKISLALFFFLSIGTLSVHSIPDYFFNVITVNQGRVGEGNILTSLFYPVTLFFSGQWNLFHIIEASIAIIFWILIFIQVRNKQFFQIIFIFIALALANVRPNHPGEIYFAAFHHIQWYGLLLMTTLICLQRGKWRTLAWLGIFGITAFAILSPRSYLHDKVDRQVEFMTNFDFIFVNGGIVKAISSPKDSLFLDGWDDLIYFEAHKYSQYKYSWLTSAMPQFEKFRRARDEMFAKTPPTFFYGRCADGKLSDATIRTREIKEYIQLYPSCVFVHPSKMPEITEEQWKILKEKFAISKPSTISSP